MQVKALQEVECQGVTYNTGEVFEATAEDMEHITPFVETLSTTSPATKPDEAAPDKEARPRRRGRK